MDDEQTTKQKAVGSLDFARQEITKELGERFWVRELFPKTAIVEDMREGTLQEYPWKFTDGGKGVELGQPKEVTIQYVAKAEAADRGPELTGPIVRKDAKRHIAYAAVLVPGEPDSDGESVTAEKIEEVAHGWMEEYRNVDLQHSLNNVDASPVESYITPIDQDVTLEGKSATLPAGSWILATKVHDMQVWRAIEKGKLTGYSVMGVPKRALKEAVEAASKSEGITGLHDAGFKRTLLRDLGADWVAPFVSVVDEPAVPKAKFFALKQHAPEPRSGLAERLKAMFKQKEDEMNEQETKDLVDQSAKALKTELTDELTKSIPDAVKTAIEEGTKPLVERIEKLEGAGKTGETEGETEAEKDKDKTSSEPETVEALKAQVEELTKDSKEFKDEVLKRLDPASSRAGKGQDGDGEGDGKSSDPWVWEDVDSFGRPKKAKATKV